MNLKFEELGLAEILLKAVSAAGYHTTTQIQSAAIPPILAGRDLLGCAQTGTGKTAAFALPTLDRLNKQTARVNGRGRKIRALVLAPTRELALQICDSFQTYGQGTGLRQTTIYGGVSQGAQVRALNAGVDILVATPGRLLDLMNQGFIDLGHVEILVLDEADRMLDMGFIHDLKRIVAKVPRERQTLLFSATMPTDIRNLANQWLKDPVDVRVTPVSSTAMRIDQSVYFVAQKQKLTLLAHWLQETPWTRVLVFTRTKHGADKVVRHLSKAGIASDAIHGNKSQNARQRALERFKQPKPLVLIATDIAARGLDVDLISHVINFDLPEDPECYVHRIGRTGRADAAGCAVSFCDRDERDKLKLIQQLTRRTLAVSETPAVVVKIAAEAAREPAHAGMPHSSGQHSSGQRYAGGRSSSGRPNGGRPSSGRPAGKPRRPEGRPATFSGAASSGTATAAAPTAQRKKRRGPMSGPATGRN